MADYCILDQINKPNDIKKIPDKDIDALCFEIRQFLIENISKTGGHLSSNLGVVELTIALHKFLDFPKDKLIFDVGHQSYVHKILTGRKNFEDLRKYNGLSGFPKITESECDAFNTGHSSTAISVAAGFVAARDLKKENYKVVALVGDGAMGGGLTMEALNNIGKFKSNMIIVLNDNEMSIDKNEGGLAVYLGHLRTKKSYMKLKEDLEKSLGKSVTMRLKHIKDSFKSFFVDGMFFENLGITYIGPIDGHNVNQILAALKNASNVNKPVLIHVVTKKGKGYLPAEKNPGKFHGVGRFNIETGKLIKSGNSKTFTDTFSDTITEIGEKDTRVVAISASMEFGTGLRKFKENFPERFFDVGIAEQHAVTFAAALAANGLRPVCAIYSTFLQRAYDEIVHDVCLTAEPVVFAIDRAGITGEDGETHQGIFDLSYLSHIPNLTVMAPVNTAELKKMLEFAFTLNKPVAIRYQKGAEGELVAKVPVSDVVYGKAAQISTGTDVAIFSVGATMEQALSIKEKLENDKISVSLYNARFVSPIDREAVITASERHKVLVTIEDNVKRGGYGEAVSEILYENNCNVRFISAALNDTFIEQGKRSELLKLYGLDPEKIYGKIRRNFG